MAAGSYASMWASTADRDHVIEVVKASFAEGRLTKAELELRVGQALASRYFPELMELIADLPVGPFGRMPRHPATPAPPRTSRLATAALACAIAGPLTAGITAIPAIVVGQMALRRVRRTGERGLGFATAAVVIGWLTVLIAAVTVGLTA
jgi:Zn-dependent protease